MNKTNIVPTLMELSLMEEIDIDQENDEGKNQGGKTE